MAYTVVKRPNKGWGTANWVVKDGNRVIRVLATREEARREKRLLEQHGEPSRRNPSARAIAARLGRGARRVGAAAKRAYAAAKPHVVRAARKAGRKAAAGAKAAWLANPRDSKGRFKKALR